MKKIRSSSSMKSPKKWRGEQEYHSSFSGKTKRRRERETRREEREIEYFRREARTGDERKSAGTNGKGGRGLHAPKTKRFS
eukprot:scaffold130770_cov32-Tisochrysis_lutea.AAC.7